MNTYKTVANSGNPTIAIKPSIVIYYMVLVHKQLLKST
jgi:hypothetical protein